MANRTKTYRGFTIVETTRPDGSIEVKGINPITGGTVGPYVSTLDVANDLQKTTGSRAVDDLFVVARGDIDRLLQA